MMKQVVRELTGLCLVSIDSDRWLTDWDTEDPVLQAVESHQTKPLFSYHVSWSFTYITNIELNPTKGQTYNTTTSWP